MTTALKSIASKTYIIHQRTEDGWKMVKRTKDTSQIHPLEMWYFNHIIQEDLDYLVVGDTMYDIMYNYEYR